MNRRVVLRSLSAVALCTAALGDALGTTRPSKIRPGARDALIVVDVQNCFVRGGTLSVSHGEDVVPVINRLAPAFQNVVLTQDWHPAGHTSDAELHPALAIPQAQLIVRKGFHSDVDSYSAFEEADRKTPTGLGGYLKQRGIEALFVAGLATDFCVQWTALDALSEHGVRRIDSTDIVAG
jgi:nicotinamidase/pyrazinamidase